jgi:hypothetical protein
MSVHQVLLTEPFFGRRPRNFIRNTAATVPKEASHEEQQ